MDARLKNEIRDVLYNIGNSEQLRKLNKDEKVIKKVLRAKMTDESKAAFCAKYWKLK